MEKMQEHTFHGSALKVLLIEDSDSDALLLQKTLLEGTYNVQFTRATTLAGGEEVLEREDIDLLLLDLCLPDAATPADSCSIIRKWAEKLPVIVMTGIKDHNMAKSLIHEGAADFLNKDSLTEGPDSLQKSIDFSIERHFLSRQIQSEKNKALNDSKEKDSILRCFMGGYSIDSKNN